MVCAVAHLIHKRATSRRTEIAFFKKSSFGGGSIYEFSAAHISSKSRNSAGDRERHAMPTSRDARQKWNEDRENG
jgi:hypothetical protein